VPRGAYEHAESVRRRTTAPYLCWRDFYERGETRMSLHQGHNVTVLCAADEIALPMTGMARSLDFCGSFPDGDGVDDLTAGLAADTRVLRAAYAALDRRCPISSFCNTPRA